MKKITLLAILLSGSIFLSFKSSPVKPIKTETTLMDSTRNQPAPAFKLKDLAGNEVSLADYKGKVVVIDFWATWCEPCRYSFPAVAMAVNQYKNDTGVQFLFIDTREKVENKIELIKKFLAENKYPFKVILDEKGPDGQQNKYYKQFVMPGIPTKFIIDRNGIIRYKVVGFYPGKTTEAAAKDIADMIETTKKF